MNSWILFFTLVAGVKNGVGAIGLEVLYGPERNFTSLGFPNSYPNNTEYAWIIRGGMRVELTFHSFDLQWCPDCSCDYVEVRDGFVSLSPLIGRYCGNHTEPITVISSSEFVYVNFKTDSSISGAGFNASYAMTTKCPTLPRELVGSRKSCGLTRRKIDRNCGELDITFQDEQECSWYGETTVFRRWEFDFLDEFRFKKCPGCRCEYIEFFDGRDSSSKSLGRLCGSDKPDDVKTSGKYMSFTIKAGQSSKIHFKYRGTYSGGTLAALILVPIAVIGAVVGTFWCVCLCCVNNPTKEETSVKMTECNDEEAGTLCSAEEDETHGT